MCFRTQLNTKIKAIEKAFDSTFIEPDIFTPQEEINAFDFLKTPVITDDNPGEIDMFHWGLIPFWAKDENIKKMTLNAKIETLKEKPAFRDAINNRCLVIATGFYEWQWLDPKGKTKQKYFIKPREQEVFAFAGIYSIWRNPATGEVLPSYSIVTTEANELISRIHNIKKRMPVVLRKEDRNHWLSGGEVSNFSFPYEVQLEAQEVS